MRTLLILLWKNALDRKRNPCSLFFELFETFIFMLLMFTQRNLLKPPSPKLFMANAKITAEKFLDIAARPPSCILYSPHSELAGALMDEVGLQLGLTRLAAKPVTSCKGYYPFSSYTEIANFVDKMHSDVALVIFEDMYGESWAERVNDKLTYTIRMRRKFNTHSLEPADQLTRPHQNYGDDYDDFMRIQWAIDTSYIKVRTGNTVPQTLGVQEFPFYRSRENLDVQVKIIAGFVMIIICISGMSAFTTLIVNMMNERSSGIQELIKINGVSSSTLGLSHFLNMVPTALVFSIANMLLLKWGDNALIEHTSGVLILIALMLHVLVLLALAMVFSYVSDSSTHQSLIATMLFLAMIIPCLLLLGVDLKSRYLLLLCGLVPLYPMRWFWYELAHFEQYDKPFPFSELHRAHTANTASVLFAFFCLAAQALFAFALTWYLSQVRQGKYGNSLPWNFICMKRYWTKKNVLPRMVTSEEEEPLAVDKKYFEEPPKHLEVGIRIQNVSKFYPKHKALDNVSLDVYKGEITVLLGHNGAGKTTLMSIVTGMLRATHGKVYVNGLDTEKHSKDIRSQMGLCPQHNLFIPMLKVLEQVMFFYMLKTNSSIALARLVSSETLNKLGIGDKAGSSPDQLSGGMKRRLQLACALAGGASVLVLDEPTSGLDVETRRELWNLLLSLRGDRTVLLSTHFMEEADALGDRVAALQSGRLRCHATPMHLKKAMGTGYRLSFTTSGVPADDKITRVVTSHVSEATLKEKTMNSLTYSLPATDTHKFPKLFTELEDKRSSLGIETIGVGVSTLEEVFLKLCSDTDTTFHEDEADSEVRGVTFGKVKGCALYLRQAGVLLKRQAYFMKASLQTSLMILALSIGCIIVFTILYNDEKADKAEPDPDMLLDLNMYKMPERRMIYTASATGNHAVRNAAVSGTLLDGLGLPSTIPCAQLQRQWKEQVLMDVKATGTSMRVKNQYEKVHFADSTNVTRDLLDIGRKELLEYNKYLVGVELDDQRAKAMYTTVYRHAAPVALNFLSNVIASQYLPGAAGSIAVRNQPLQADTRPPLRDAKSSVNCRSWAVVMVFMILMNNINFASLPCRERASGARHIHVMAGCPAALHWLCALAWHAAVTALTLVLATALAAVLLDRDQTLAQTNLLLSLSLVLIVGSIAFYPILYMLSFVLTERNVTGIASVLVFMFVIATPASTLISIQGWISAVINFSVFLVNCVMPPHAMTVAAGKITYVGRLNALCELNKARCPDMDITYPGFDSDQCCAGNRVKYFTYGEYGAAAELTILIAQSVVYMIVVILMQRGLIEFVKDRVYNFQFLKRTSSRSHADEVIAAEALYVSQDIELPKQRIKDAMLVNEIHKRYVSCCCTKEVHAVRGLSFSVKKGECFGLLGANGAGKSTTFKMLTTVECTTKGNIFANGHFVNLREKNQYLNLIGYCPQFFGIDEFQTGHDNLKMLLTLRGLDDKDVERELKDWIDVIGLQKYSNVLASAYSGGYLRRLAAAAALSAGTPLTLLDEPTAGVDVGARRRVHTALRKTLRQGRSVVITSHSMDEMEALCARIGIMSRGSLGALGTPAELRARHAQGHALVIKINSPQDEDGASSELEKLKSSLHSKFDCTLKDEHQTMLHYHINNTLRYSELFKELENLREAFPGLIEDYSVTETTLEEVFLYIAKENQDDNAT